MIATSVFELRELHFTLDCFLYGRREYEQVNKNSRHFGCGKSTNN